MNVATITVSPRIGRSRRVRRVAKAALASAAMPALIWLATPLVFLPYPATELAGSPADVGLQYETLTIHADGGAVPLTAWWMPAERARGLVLLIHDGNANRSFLWSNALPLARSLHDEGYAVLAPDLRGHGGSGSGEEGVPVGGNLAADMSLWIDEALRRTGDLPVVAVGFGLGGQVAIYAGARDLRIAGVAADSTWADLKSSVTVSIPAATGLPSWFVRSAIWCAENVYGIDFAHGRAVDVVGKLSGRLLLVTNEEDPQMPRRQLRALEHAAGEAEVWITPAPLPDHPLYASAGTWGTHSRSSDLYPAQYSARIAAFVARCIAMPAR